MINMVITKNYFVIYGKEGVNKKPFWGVKHGS